MSGLVDISRAIWDGMPRLRSLPEVSIESLRSTERGDPLSISMLHMPSHAGTHIDAPAHAIPGAATIDELSVDRFIAPGVVIPVDAPPGGPIDVGDLQRADVEIRRGDIVLLSTGWARHFNDDLYHDHPAPTPELADWLVEIGANMLGVDMVTVDVALHRRGADFDYPVHRRLLANDVLIIENLADMSGLAGHRVKVHAIPLSVRGGDAGHARVLAERADD